MTVTFGWGDNLNSLTFNTHV